MIIKFLSPILILLLLTSCSREDDAPAPEVYEVRLYALAPVLLAVVTDKNGQIAEQKDLSQNIYTFATKPTLPLSAVSNGATTFIDTDFDGVRSAFDLVYDEELHANSFKAITHLNDALLHAADLNISDEFNTTKYASALSDMKIRFSLSADDIENQTPRTASSKNVGILSDTLTLEKENNRFDPTKLQTLSFSYKLISDFYSEHMSRMNIVNAVKYHESFSALELIDEQLVTRAIENEKPRIPAYLNSEYLDAIDNIPQSALLSSTYNFSNLSYLSLSFDDNNSIAYVAAGNDGLDTISTVSAVDKLANDYNDTTKVFSSDVTYIDKNGSRCIFVASQEDQVDIYGVSPLSAVVDSNVNKFVGKYIGLTSNAKAYGVEYYETAHKKLLLVSNGVVGLEIVDIQNIECNSSQNLDASMRYNTAAIGSDTRAALALGFKIYSADGVNGIYITDIQGQSPVISGPFTLENNESAYDLHMVEGINGLFISTQRGLQIYDIVRDTNSTNFQGLYHTEGSHQSASIEVIKVSGSQNNKALFVADLSGGVKVLDIRDSKNPKLCGVAHFSALNSLEQTPVRDIKISEKSNGDKNLYITVDSIGLIKIEDAKSILFEHCKTLLD